MKKKAEQAYLFDFYKELLNEHQQKIYEDFVFQDLSLAEIAEEEGISRQGVHDLVRRCTKTLEDYENKLHLVSKFLFVREKVEEIKRLSHTMSDQKKETIIQEIELISNEILEEL